MSALPLYPDIAPFMTHRLDVGDGHEIYVEESGNPRGVPVIFFHGGPGGGSDPLQRRFFDPAHYRIVLFDQRGAGKSTPHAGLEHNTTWKLVEDTEKIRAHLGIENWHLFGGSWGSTLALIYAITHPDRCLSMTLRGIFLVRQAEVDWFYQAGASRIFPEAFARYRDFIDEDERGDLLSAYYRRLLSSDEELRVSAAREWSRWEASCSRLQPMSRVIDRAMDARFALAIARIEAHYFVNKGFLEEDGWILKHANKLAILPTEIVQGRYDIVCPPTSAVDLAAELPNARLRMIGDAGHASSEPGVVRALVDATDKFRAL